MSDKTLEGRSSSGHKGDHAFAPLPSPSGKTKWGQPAKHLREESVWHGFGYVGAFRDKSYCGVEYDGDKRSSPPPRGDKVCEKCAERCGFVRRKARHPGRQRGSRRLGSVTERLEAAVDALERLVEAAAEG